MRLEQAFFNSNRGPQHREFQKEILQAMQVGGGPQHREFQKEILQIFNYTLAVADV
ncbi:hypothetical protein ACXQCF_02245 [Staphylococcus argenteus]